jgi:hypothetical protein
VPDDYLELIRVIVWHNRQCLKMGLHVLSPKELEEFLYEEMSQDFSDLGIESKDFLADLLKAREENQKSFDIYKNYIKLKTDNSPCPTVNNITESSTPLLSPNNKSGTHDTKQTWPPPATLPPSNLLGKFASVSGESSNQAVQVTDKPIHLKNKEMRRHEHRYDLRIGIKECRSEEEEQKLLTGLLEEFMETMLSADQSIIIPTTNLIAPTPHFWISPKLSKSQTLNHSQS